MNTAAVLSRREAEIAPLLVYGKTKKEAANDLYRSVRTIENHARSIYEKTGCRNIAELCVWWFHKTYDTPLTYSTDKKKALALFLLMLFIPFEFSHSQDTQMVRGRRVEFRGEKTRQQKDVTRLLIEI